MNERYPVKDIRVIGLPDDPMLHLIAQCAISFVYDQAADRSNLDGLIAHLNEGEVTDENIEIEIEIENHNSPFRADKAPNILRDIHKYIKQIGDSRLAHVITSIGRYGQCVTNQQNVPVELLNKAILTIERRLMIALLYDGQTFVCLVELNELNQPVEKGLFMFGEFADGFSPISHDDPPKTLQ